MNKLNRDNPISVLDTIKHLKSERDALVVMIESLIKAIKAIENDCIECSYDDESGYFIGNDAMSNACELAHYATPQQALAEIRAEAGRAGFIAGAATGHAEGYDYGLIRGENPTGFDFSDEADQYAEQIRQGGAA